MNTTATEAASLPAPLGTRITIAVAVILFIGILIFVSVAPLSPPDAVAADAAPAEFLSARAMQHLSAISQSPHPTGSAAQNEVRQYILGQLTALGVKAEVQEASSISN